MSGIDYELDIKHHGENQTQTILKYRADKSNEGVPVSDIIKHLSWGERNAFALVLFMHYALSNKPKLIILDDPISSFDTNKKYAIINRLFANVKGKGSGTTAIASLKTNREYIGYDNNQNYVRLASQRISNYRKENNILF